MARVQVSMPRSLGAGPSRPVVLGLDARTVLEAVTALAHDRPDLGPRLLAPDGSLRRSVAVYLHGTDIRELDDGPATPLAEGDTIEIVPALAGG